MTETKPEPKKQCADCKDWKPLSDFHKEKAKPLGRQSYCKFCKQVRDAARRAAAETQEQPKGGPDGQEESDAGLPAH